MVKFPGGTNTKDSNLEDTKPRDSDIDDEEEKLFFEKEIYKSKKKSHADWTPTSLENVNIIMCRLAKKRQLNIF